MSPKNHPEVINWLVSKLGEVEAKNMHQQLSAYQQLAILDQAPMSEELILEFLDYALSFKTDIVITAVNPELINDFKKVGFELMQAGNNEALMMWG